MSYIDRVAKNLFLASVEQHDVKKALQEWEYRDTRFDRGYADEICQLCDQEDIRFQFEIVNINNNNILLIGSKCILRYSDIGVVDDSGTRLTKTAAARKVNRDARELATQARIRSVLKSLLILSRIPGNTLDFEDLFRKYEEEEAFTPRQLFAAIYRLDVTKTPHVKKYFKLRLKKKIYQRQIVEMELNRIGRIWGCLPDNQKEIIRKLRGDIPRTPQWA